MEDFVFFNRDRMMAPGGFPNSGQVCYLNSLLQALLSCTSLREIMEIFVLDYENQKSYNPKLPEPNKMARIFAEIYNSRPQFRFDQWPTFVHRILNMELASRGMPGFMGQSSASETLVKLLECINMSYVYRLFGVTYLSSLQCQACGEASIKKDVSIQINMFGDQVKALTTKEAFERYIYEHYEALDGYKCDKCHAPVTRRSYKLTGLPEILVLVFNKYTTIDPSKLHLQLQPRYQNQDQHIQFFPPNLDFNLKKGNVQYALVSQLEHVGTVKQGHYYTRGQRSSGVYIFDDMTYNISSFLHTPNTYMLFYHVCN